MNSQLSVWWGLQAAILVVLKQLFANSLLTSSVSKLEK